MDRKTCIAMVLAGGRGRRIAPITVAMPKPALSFGGVYRLIDFVLSNCANSHIEDVALVTQFLADYIHNYVGNGDSWGYSMEAGTLHLLPSLSAAQEDAEANGLLDYQGTADAIYQNIHHIRKYSPQHVLILPADQVYQMDYRPFFAEHVKTGADISIAATPVDAEAARQLGMMARDAQGRITAFIEKPTEPRAGLASMGIYLFRTEVLLALLEDDAQNTLSSHDFAKDLFPLALERKLHLHAYEYQGFWRDVGTVESYYETSLQLLDDEPILKIDDPRAPLCHHRPNLSPARVLPGAQVDDSLLAGGCAVQGTVRHSIVSCDAVVEAGAYVQDSVLLPGAKVEAGARVVRALIANDTTVPAGMQVAPRSETRDLALLEYGTTAPSFLSL